MPKEPEKPKVKEIVETLRPNYSDRIGILPNILNPNAFRKEVEISDRNCSVTIRDLHVGDKVDLFKKNLIIKKATEEIVFRVTIRSKESTRVLNPIVSVEYQKSFNVLFETNNN